MWFSYSVLQWHCTTLVTGIYFDSFKACANTTKYALILLKAECKFAQGTIIIHIPTGVCELKCKHKDSTIMLC